MHKLTQWYSKLSGKSIILPADYTLDYYKYHLIRYINNDTWSQERINNVLSIVANVTKGEYMLDLGCGIGTFVIEFSKLGAEVIGIDYSHIATRVSKEIAKKFNVDAEIIQCDAKYLPFRSEVFNKVVAADLIEHLTKLQYESSMKEVNRILMSSGIVCLYTPNPLKVQSIIVILMILVKISQLLKGSRQIKSREYRDEVLEYFKKSDIIYSRLHVDLKSPFYVWRTLTRFGFKTKVKVRTGSIIENFPVISYLCGGRLMVRAVKRIKK